MGSKSPKSPPDGLNWTQSGAKKSPARPPEPPTKVRGLFKKRSVAYMAAAKPPEPIGAKKAKAANDTGDQPDVVESLPPEEIETLSQEELEQLGAAPDHPAPPNAAAAAPPPPEATGAAKGRTLLGGFADAPWKPAAGAAGPPPQSPATQPRQPPAQQPNAPAQPKAAEAPADPRAAAGDSQSEAAISNAPEHPGGAGEPLAMDESRLAAAPPLHGGAAAEAPHGEAQAGQPASSEGGRGRMAVAATLPAAPGMVAPPAPAVASSPDVAAPEPVAVGEGDREELGDNPFRARRGASGRVFVPLFVLGLAVVGLAAIAWWRPELLPPTARAWLPGSWAGPMAPASDEASAATEPTAVEHQAAVPAAQAADTTASPPDQPDAVPTGVTAPDPPPPQPSGHTVTAEGEQSEAVQAEQTAEPTEPGAGGDATGGEDAQDAQDADQRTQAATEQPQGPDDGEATAAAAREALEDMSMRKLLRRGASMLRAGDLQGARAALERALELDPDEHHAMEDLARIEMREGNYDDAVTLTARIVDKRPRRASYRLLHGDALAKSGDVAAAREQWETLLRLKPGHPVAKARLAR